MMLRYCNTVTITVLHPHWHPHVTGAEYAPSLESRSQGCHPQGVESRFSQSGVPRRCWFVGAAATGTVYNFLSIKSFWLLCACSGQCPDLYRSNTIITTRVSCLHGDKVRLQTSCSPRAVSNPTPCWTCQIQARPNQPWAQCSLLLYRPPSAGAI
jgi:hypothetical protein